MLCKCQRSINIFHKKKKSQLCFGQMLLRFLACEAKNIGKIATIITLKTIKAELS